MEEIGVENVIDYILGASRGKPQGIRGQDKHQPASHSSLRARTQTRIRMPVLPAARQRAKPVCYNSAVARRRSWLRSELALDSRFRTAAPGVRTPDLDPIRFEP
ncbi:hypothetical protein [Paraburkholderia sp. J41]|uniref:hypothetical protein n=1 Tax=Paraburkholderia sp. J41 TaxID=2805433 RepID=UPI002AC330F2|nr:hypothetical protein [Paraburkholderia sp. J41]